MFEAPKARLDLRRNSFSHRKGTAWNSLPSSVVECDFLNRVKGINGYFYPLTLLST